ncbi:MAG: hypothetical protein ACSHYA_05050 [Opitutaceae bacterium]
MGTTATVRQWKHPFDDFRRERRWATVFALVAAILVHIGVFIVVPDVLLQKPSSASTAGENAIELTLVPEEELTPDQLKFVEANPEAPENEPDRKDQYSYRSQQAASENVSDTLLEAPEVDGETDSQKILEGSLDQAEPLPPGVYTPVAKQGEGEGADGGKLGTTAQEPIAPSKPLPPPAFLEQEPVTDDGPGSRLETPGKSLEVAEDPDPNAPIDLYRPQPQQTPVAQQQDGDGNGGVQAKPMPRARPRLAPELIQGPLMQSRGTTRLRGTLAIDATFSEFGEYQQQFFAALQTGWYQEIEFYQPIDTATSVQVQFTVQSDGIVKDVEVIQSTASEIATIICESAIIKRSPYRPWTREMVQVFGNERTMRVRFHYR